ncbi:MAG TPA: NADH-quinone oxidoreductase subunit L [Candidatus Acidoferrales bacterium]|nr:NADH-quinone oxidoreductase subunit L [Candidatus Acidoferrales bacterium]
MNTGTYFLEHIGWIPLFPLAGAALMILFGRRLPKAVVSLLCVGSVFVSFVFSVFAVIQLAARPAEERVFQKILFEWIPAMPYHMDGGLLSNFSADWGMLLDPLSSVMILVVTGVGLLIHIYSIGYMGHEGGYYRFFGYMNLFMFSMLTLVLANNLLLMFVGWEGVGLCSYLLIGFYFLKKSAADAGKKAFVVNRVGDSGFILGIFLASAVLGTIRFSSQGLAGIANVPGMNEVLRSGAFPAGASVLTAMAILFFIGATGKSAQIPLYIWLPDAMEGPTPVSALIHAATMVTAGVYMIARMNALYQLAPKAMLTVAVVGGLTAFYAATMGLVQNDIKRVLAYSTISQLGYMFLALGVGAFAAGIFHLMTHAFFKALLFLGSGSVIHAMSGEQDMQKMGALRSKIPVTAWTFVVAALAIAGMPPLAGFFSKDEILWKTFSAGDAGVYKALHALALFTAGLTAFYMFRLVFLTFFGKSRVEQHVEPHIHECPASMRVPLVILAVLAALGGLVGIPHSLGGGSHFERWLEPVVARVSGSTEAASVHGSPAEYGLMLLSVVTGLAGIWLAWHIYLEREGLADRIAARWPGLYELLYHKYYGDEVYDSLFVNRTKDLATTLGDFDRGVVDGLGVDGSAWLTRFSSTVSIWWDKWIVDGLVNLSGALVRFSSYPVRMFETGLVQNYALFILFGVLLFMGAYLGGPVVAYLRSLLHSV